MSNVWIVVADGAKASLTNYSTDTKQFESVSGGELNHVNKPTRDLVTGKRGRVFQSAGSGRSAMEPPSDPREHEKVVFATEIANELERREKEYDQLVLVAAPKTLGELRNKISKTIKDKVAEEIDKDLTNESPSQMEDHLRELIDFKKFHLSGR
jgi:protein required for attachment to host cells